MTVFAIVLAVILLLGILWIMLIAGRTSNKDTEKFTGIRYAHRGLHREGIPENSLAAFKAAVEKGYAIELDVHLLKDGYIAVMHDDTLLRTTGAEGQIEDLTRAELKNYRLEGTEEHIPTFSEVLELVDGKVPLLIEVKTGKNNPSLCSALMWELRDYKGLYCIESFDPRCVRWFKKNCPSVVRGQLADNFFKNKGNLSFPFRFVLSLLILNSVTQPDFVAFNHKERNFLSNRISKDFWNVKGFCWTVKSERQMKRAEKKGYTVIFEDFEP